MPLKIYNTQAQTKVDFQPLKPPQVKMYVCGITVYDYCHLGHARAAVVFDVIYRFLKHLGYQVEYVRNFTDIDDKIIKRANENAEDWRELTQRFIQAFHEDMAALGNESPTTEPKATDYITAMQEMIQKLIDQGLAYESGGDVFYAVRNFKSYGALAHKDIEDLAVGARVEVQESKRDPLDFALWKAAKPGEPKWESPWGEGRPGWHIECSVMSTALLGDTLDIHGGGRDLIFPHHENERAQSEGATGQTFVKHWLHNGFVNLNADKMSKSTGNFLTIRKVLEQYSFEAVRYLLLSSHYRSPLDFSDQSMSEATAAVERVYETLQRLQETNGEPEGTPATEEATEKLKELDRLLQEFKPQFQQVMEDDFNTAQVLALCFEIARQLNRWLDEKPAASLIAERRPKVGACFSEVAQVLGLFGQEPAAFWENKKQQSLKESALSPEAIEEKIAERKQARANKDFAKADQVRDELAELGIILKDNPDGTTTWTT